MSLGELFCWNVEGRVFKARVTLINFLLLPLQVSVNPAYQALELEFVLRKVCVGDASLLVIPIYLLLQAVSVKGGSGGTAQRSFHIRLGHIRKSWLGGSWLKQPSPRRDLGDEAAVEGCCSLWLPPCRFDGDFCIMFIPLPLCQYPPYPPVIIY